MAPIFTRQTTATMLNADMSVEEMQAAIEAATKARFDKDHAEKRYLLGRIKGLSQGVINELESLVHWYKDHNVDLKLYEAVVENVEKKLNEILDDIDQTRSKVKGSTEMIEEDEEKEKVESASLEGGEVEGSGSA